MVEIIELDKVDRRLLFALDFHARDDFNVLSRTVGISSKETEERMYKLIERGVIKGFHPVLDIPKLGYLYCRITITLQNCPKEKEEDISDYLINHPNVFWAFRMQGMYDFHIIMWTESITQFTDFIKEIEKKFGKFIKKRLEVIVTDITYFQDRFLTGTRETEELHIKETQERIAIDKLDRRILQFLSINARFTLTELSLNLKEEENTISERIKRLERTKLILAYRPLIEHWLIGYTWYKVWVNINKTSQRRFVELFKEIKSNPITLWIIEGIGLPADLEIEVMVKSNEELFGFINNLRSKFPTMVEDFTTVAFTETLKELYLPFY